MEEEEVAHWARAVVLSQRSREQRVCCPNRLNACKRSRLDTTEVKVDSSVKSWELRKTCLLPGLLAAGGSLVNF